jgi:hypothetical protein
MEPAPQNDKNETLLNVREEEVNINENAYTSINASNQILCSEAAPQFPSLEMLNSQPQSDLLIDNNINYPVPECQHWRLDLEVEIDKCGTCICTSCCIMGFIGLIVFIIAILSKTKGSSSRSRYTNIHVNNSPVIIWTDHWLYHYSYDREFIEPRMNRSKVIDAENATAACCGMNYPHRYKIKCMDCSKVMKEGYKEGSFYSAFVFGLIGTLFLVMGIIILIRKMK